MENLAADATGQSKTSHKRTIHKMTDGPNATQIRVASWIRKPTISLSKAFVGKNSFSSPALHVWSRTT